MAITLIGRPKSLIAELSPEGFYYSKWNATGIFDKINYTFNIQSIDLASKLIVNVKEFGSNLLLSSNTYRPFKTGSLVVDVAPFVRSYLYSLFDPDFTAVNSIDVGASLRFYIEYIQIDEEGTSTIANDNANPMYAVNAAMEIGNENASNMLTYVPINADITDKALFLTDFQRPVWFEGYSMTLSFIFDHTLGGKEIYLTQKELNAAGVEIDENEFLLDTSKINRVNYVVLQTVENSLTKTLNVSLRTQNNITDTYVDSGYVDEGYVQTL